MSTQRTFLCHFCTHGCPLYVSFHYKSGGSDNFQTKMADHASRAGPVQLQGCLASYIAYKPCWYNLCLLHRVLPHLLQSLIPTSCTSQLFSPTSCTTSTPAPHFALLFLSLASETTCINRPVYTAMSRST